MKALKVIFGNLHSRIWVIVTAAVLVVAIVCNFVAFNVVSKVFDNLWGGDTSSGRGEGGTYTLDEGITNKETSLANANSVNEQICEEGFVLLKNEGVLPLQTSPTAPKKVSVFGKNSVNLVYSNSGSGGGNTAGARTTYESLEEAGYAYNPTLKSFYESDASGAGRPESPTIGSGGVTTGFEVGETAAVAYGADVKQSFAEYSDLAIVVISRTCGEAADAPTAMRDDTKSDGKIEGAYSAEDHYLELDKNEQDMLQMVCENFEKVVLVINSNNTMELGFLDGIADGDETALGYDFASKIGAAIWIGTPGGSGIMALGRILNGEVNPSGRTVDTYARDFTSIPAYENLAYQTESKTSSAAYLVGTAVQDEYYSDYEEGIYVGYRYFETRGATDGEEWYKNNVVYPFGYGLSYTDFEWTADLSALDGAVLTESDPVSVTVNVKNIGAYAGKDVVQLYVRAPYTAGEIEKADKVLVAFAKTDLLDAKTGEGTVTLTFDAYDLASYDYNDANKNGFTGYEVEQGTYEFFISSDAHTSALTFSMKVEEDICFRTSVEGGEEVVDLFSDADDQLGSVLSRTDWEGTWPQERTQAERTVDSAFLDRVNSKQTNNSITDESEEVQSADLSYATKKDREGIQLYDLIGVEYEDKKWDELLSKMTISTMHELRQLSAFGSAAIDYISKPKTIEPDGPLGYTQFMGGGNEVTSTCLYASECVVASTWNVEMAEKQGIAVGNESLIGDGSDKYSGWYAPGVNLHRTPFGGRNAEYYSEDCVLSGKMAASLIEGAASKGVYTYMKHFVANEQETHRNGVCTWLTEQSLRELYLKPFEIAITDSDGKANAVMSSFNRLGTLWTGGDYRLLTQVLRGEWGFVGVVISDFSVNIDYMDTKQMAYAGGDVNLTNLDAKWVDTNSKTDVYILKQCAKNYLYVIANSNAMNGIDADSEYTTHMATWKKVVIGIDCALAAALVVWGIFAIRSAFKREKGKDEMIVKP